MKTIFIPVKSKIKINPKDISKISKDLPNNIAITYSIQYLNQAKEIKLILSKEHAITLFTQTLGCSKPLIPKQTEAILIITDGKFHAISLALETKLPVYIYNNSLTKISEDEITKLKNSKKSSYLKFLNADKIGILASTKPGQENLTRAIKLKDKLKDKNSYIFVSNNIDINEFENFPDIGCWVNTACPRIDMNEKGIVNFGEIKS